MRLASFFVCEKLLHDPYCMIHSMVQMFSKKNQLLSISGVGFQGLPNGADLKFIAHCVGKR